MEVSYDREPDLDAHAFADLLERSGLAERRPADDLPRLDAMLRNASLIITARDCQHRRLVGIARAISDFCYCTYLSDLAVDARFQRQGIGRRLVDLTHQWAGYRTQLILLAAPKARAYYPHIGMTQHDSCWVFPPRASNDNV